MHLLTLRIGRYRFAPTVWPTLATAALFALTLWLGNWQSERADGKRALQAQHEAAMREPAIHVGAALLDRDSVLHRRLEADGTFDDAHGILLDNRVHAGVAGYHVLTPLRIEGSDRAILVNRGWVAAGHSRSVLPPVPVPPGRVHVEGIGLDPESRYVELGNAQPQGRLWQNLDIVRYAKQHGLRLQPVVLRQSGASPDGLVRDWPRPDAGVAMHVGYAFQWYSLSATLAVLWLAMNVKRLRGDETKPETP